MGVGGQRYAPVVLPPGTTRYQMCRRLGGPQARSGRVRKILPPPPNRIRSLDRVAIPTELYRPKLNMAEGELPGCSACLWISSAVREIPERTRALRVLWVKNLNTLKLNYSRNVKKRKPEGS